MTMTNTAREGDVAFADYDVFAAARWLGELWNSTAKAVSLTEVDWQCSTWGSGNGHGDWLDTATFRLISGLLDLDTWSNDEGRDELVVHMRLSQFGRAATLIDRLGEEAEAWPWFDEDAEGRELEVAAATLDIPVADLAANQDLLKALRID